MSPTKANIYIILFIPGGGVEGEFGRLDGNLLDPVVPVLHKTNQVICTVRISWQIGMSSYLSYLGLNRIFACRY